MIFTMPITAVLVLLIEATMIAIGVAYITDYCPSIKQQPKPHSYVVYRTGNKSSAQYMYELYSRKRMKGNRYRRTMTTAVARMN